VVSLEAVGAKDQDRVVRGLYVSPQIPGAEGRSARCRQLHRAEICNHNYPWRCMRLFFSTISHSCWSGPVHVDYSGEQAGLFGGGADDNRALDLC
jgi:hypothetical protein